MKKILIVSKAENGVIGVNGDLPWRLSSDLKYFRQQTTPHAIIMGRKTYESIGKPLPDRQNIVVTRAKDYDAPGCVVVNTIDAAFEAVDRACAYIMGGAEIYRQTLDQADELLITEVEAAPEGDAFFPEIDWRNWRCVSDEKHSKDEKNNHNYAFTRWVRQQ